MIIQSVTKHDIFYRLSLFPLPISEMKLDYYHQNMNVRVVSVFLKRLKA